MFCVCSLLFFCFLFPIFLEIIWTFSRIPLGFLYTVFWMYLFVLLAVALHITLCIYNSPQFTNAIILPIQVKHRKLTWFFIILLSLIYNCIKHFLYIHLGPHQWYNCINHQTLFRTLKRIKKVYSIYPYFCFQCYFFLVFHASSFYYFMFTEHHLTVLLELGLLATNCFNFLSSENVLLSPSSMKDILPGYRILIGFFFSFST